MPELPALEGDAERRLLPVLQQAQELGFLGPGPLHVHVSHALRFAAACPSPPDRMLDLGSGGGVPGLVLAAMWPSSEVVLFDAAERRTAFLHQAAVSADLPNVEVVRGRAEEAAHEPALRATFDVVTARSFGAPAVTAECGAPFLKVCGLLLVSEPPEAGERWPDAGLAQLRLVRRQYADPFVAVLFLESHVPEAFPRRVGIPSKRPLF